MNRSTMNINSLSVGEQLYRLVKAGFTANGGSLTEWCRTNKVNPTNARAALMGSWNGPKAKVLVIKIVKSSGLASLPSLAA